MLRCKFSSPHWLPLMTGLCVLALTAGCGKNPEAQFAWRDATHELLPDARKGVQAAVNEAFGTPHDLVAWDKLPVHFGGVQGVVAPESLSATTFQVQWDGPADGIGKGSELFWMTGALAKSKTPTATVASYNPETKTVELKKSHADTPAAGDRLAVGLGSQLQLGRMVYMKNCNHCHGVAGDGNGPTAQYLNPRPRDYRLGLFKFTSTLSSEKAAREDLDRIITYGIPGTYMPSFLLLGNNDGGKEKAAVIEYIRWLAMRGEMEKRLVDELSGDYSEIGLAAEAEKEKKSYADAKNEYDKARKAGNKDAEKPEAAKSLSQLKKAAGDELKKFLEEDFPGTINDTSDFIADAWKRADDPASRVVPTVARVTDDAASRERGRLLYMSDKTKCYTCHGAKGRGNGAAIEDFWKKPGSNETYEKRGLHDTWGNPLAPRDLTRGQYRGGRRPIDIFARVYAGIKGTPMPAFGGTVLKDSDIWDIVNFVMSLPFEEQTPSAKPAAAPHMAATEAVSQ